MDRSRGIRSPPQPLSSPYNFWEIWVLFLGPILPATGPISASGSVADVAAVGPIQVDRSPGFLSVLSTPWVLSPVLVPFSTGSRYYPRFWGHFPRLCNPGDVGHLALLGCPIVQMSTFPLTQLYVNLSRLGPLGAPTCAGSIMHELGTYLWVLIGLFLAATILAILLGGSIVLFDEIKLRRLLRREARRP